MPRFEQIQTTSRLSDQVYTILRDSIISGKIKPGEWLRQESLASELGVSQITVREALSRVVAEGLASYEPYKGVRTFTITLNDLEDVYEMRALLEGKAMQMAAERIRPADLQRMRKLIPESVWRVKDDHLEPARESNRAFHFIAIEASRRKHLVRVLTNIWSLIDPYFIFTPSMGKYISQEEVTTIAHGIEAEHMQLVEALETRNGELARRLTEQSICDALDLIRRMVSGKVQRKTDPIF